MENWVPMDEATLVCEMANRWQDDTLLPMIIWIDETQSYLDGHRGKQVKFQLDTSGKLKKGRENLGSMDLNGKIHNPKSPTRLRGLSASDLNQLRNFVLNNKYALEHIADMDIHIGQIWSDIIKGGEPASFEEIQKLNLKVDELIERNKEA
jgi:hypothetical protein